MKVTAYLTQADMRMAIAEYLHKSGFDVALEDINIKYEKADQYPYDEKFSATAVLTTSNPSL